MKSINRASKIVLIGLGVTVFLYPSWGFSAPKKGDTPKRTTSKWATLDQVVKQSKAVFVSEITEARIDKKKCVKVYLGEYWVKQTLFGKEPPKKNRVIRSVKQLGNRGCPRVNISTKRTYKGKISAPFQPGQKIIVFYASSFANAFESIEKLEEVKKILKTR